MLARQYDALHGPKKDILCAATDTGSGGYTHRFFQAPKSTEDYFGNHESIRFEVLMVADLMGQSGFVEQCMADLDGWIAPDLNQSRDVSIFNVKR